MKPNKKQIEVAKIIESQGRFWQTTNDINSPTHYNDMEDEINNMNLPEEVLTYDESTALMEHLNRLYYFIKLLK